MAKKEINKDEEMAIQCVRCQQWETAVASFPLPNMHADDCSCIFWAHLKVLKQFSITLSAINRSFLQGTSHTIGFLSQARNVHPGDILILKHTMQNGFSKGAFLSKMGRWESHKLQQGETLSPGRGEESPQDRLESSLAEKDMEVVVATTLKMSHQDVLAAKTPTSTWKRALAAGQGTFCNEPLTCSLRNGEVKAASRRVVGEEESSWRNSHLTGARKWTARPMERGKWEGKK